MQGLHLTADMYQCRCDDAWLTDARQLAQYCRELVGAVGLDVVGELVHTFGGEDERAGGVAALLLLPQSHVCVHTWPGRKGVTADVYVCNAGGDHSAKARGLMFALVNRFQPQWTEQRSLDRGDEA